MEAGFVVTVRRGADSTDIEVPVAVEILYRERDVDFRACRTATGAANSPRPSAIRTYIESAAATIGWVRVSVESADWTSHVSDVSEWEGAGSKRTEAVVLQSATLLAP